MPNISSPITITTLHRAFQAAATKKADLIEAGADYRAHQNKNPLVSFFNSLFSFISPKYATDSVTKIAAKREALKAELPDIAIDMMAIKVTKDGKMVGKFTFTIGEDSYTLKQDNDLLILQSDQNPSEPITLEGVSFSQLKSAMLGNYLDSERAKVKNGSSLERAEGNSGISLDGFKLKNMNFDGIDFTNVTISSKKQFYTLMQNSANLTGAKFAVGTTDWKLSPTQNLCLAMAQQLILGGSEPQKVIRLYLDSNSPDKSLVSFNLRGIDLREMKLDDVELSSMNLREATYDKTILNAKLDPVFRKDISEIIASIKPDSTVILSQHRSNKYSSRY